MSEEMKKLIEDYSLKHKKWRELVDSEVEIRQEIIDKHGKDGREPEGLRELLDEEVVKRGLRQEEVEALDNLKEAERKLFNYNFDNCKDPELKAELEHLAIDYAARITWLTQFLEIYDEILVKES